MVDFEPKIQFRKHTAIARETLNTIVHQIYGFRGDDIRKAMLVLARINNIKGEERGGQLIFAIKPGQKLKLPSIQDMKWEMNEELWHLVKRGETLEIIVKDTYRFESDREIEDLCMMIALDNEKRIGRTELDNGGIYTLKPGTWIKLLPKKMATVLIEFDKEDPPKRIEPESVPGIYDPNQQQPEMILKRILLGINPLKPLRPLPSVERDARLNKKPN